MITKFDGSEHAFLSNFFPCPTPFGTLTFPTVEHAYQAAKTANFAERFTIKYLPSPGAAKRFGRQFELRPNWDAIKVPIMRSLLRQKFRPETDLARRLLETHTEVLVEGNNWGDRFFGMVQNSEGAWEGENWLGKLLMEIRDELVEIELGWAVPLQ